MTLEDAMLKSIQEYYKGNDIHTMTDGKSEFTKPVLDKFHKKMTGDGKTTAVDASKAAKAGMPLSSEDIPDAPMAPSNGPPMPAKPTGGVNPSLAPQPLKGFSPPTKKQFVGAVTKVSNNGPQEPTSGF